MTLPLGSELWALYFDREANNYEPRFEGTIEAIGYQGYFAGGQWHSGHPLFGSREECEAWIAEHPHSVPTIKP